MKKRLTLFAIAMLMLSMVPMAALNAQGDAPELLIWADETRASVIDELGAGFEEDFGVTLTVQQLDFGDIRDQLGVAAPAGEGPDVIVGPHDWLGELVSNGLVAPVDLGDRVSEFSEAAIAAFTWDGELYGVPYAVENVGFFYNTDLVPEPPTTWDEVRAISEELESSGAAEYGFVRGGGDPYHFFPIQTAFGGYIFGRDDVGNYTPEDIGVANDGSIAALEWLQGMVRDGLMPAGLDNPGALALMLSGEAAMTITGPWNIGELRDEGVPFAIAPFPAGPGGQNGVPFLGVNAFMVSAFSENPFLAQAFLSEFVGSEEVQLALYEQGDRAPALLSAAEKVDDPDLSALAEIGTTGQAMPNIPAMSGVWAPWGDTISLVEQDATADPAALATEAAEVIAEAAGVE